MAENQVDGGSDAGTATNADGGASEIQSDQQPSFDAAKLQESLDALNSGLATLAKRVDGLQGVKDKQGDQIKGLAGKIADYEKLKEKYGAEGALEQIEFKDQFQQMGQTLQNIQEQISGSVSTLSGGTGASGAVKADKVISTLEGYGIETNTPDVIALLKKGATETELDKFVLNKLKPQSPASAAGLATGATTGGASTRKMKETEIEQKSARLNALYKEPTKNAKEIYQLEQELEPYLP